MHVFLFAALLLAPRFWETKAARQFTDEELIELMSNSPWAETTWFRGESPLPVYLATARPLREAEAEWLRRYTARLGPGASQLDPAARTEYEQFLAENQGKVIVLAIREPIRGALARAEETRRMEEESYLKAGKQKLKMIGHFPPAGADPALRFVFPKPDPLPKELSFELYVPGVTGPYRQAVFRIKDMTFAGQLEM